VHRKLHSEILKERNHLDDLGVDGRVSRVRRGRVEVCEVNSTGSRQGPVAGSFGMYTEPLDSVKYYTFLDQVVCHFRRRTLLNMNIFPLCSSVGSNTANVHRT